MATKVIQIDRESYYVFPIDFIDKMLIEINRHYDEEKTRRLMKMYRKMINFTERYTEEKDIIYVKVKLFSSLKKEYEKSSPF